MSRARELFLRELEARGLGLKEALPDGRLVVEMSENDLTVQSR